jgi:spermidine/putrescine transport system ATP-binding protein
MTVFENVAFGLRMQKTPASEIPRASRKPCGWCSWRVCPAKPHQLSGGQQQRVAIARAVVNKPRLLRWMNRFPRWITSCKQMQNELKALQRKLGITFVFVTHDQEEALTMSDRIVVMRDGKSSRTARRVKSTKSRKPVCRQLHWRDQYLDATVIERWTTMRANVEGRMQYHRELRRREGTKLNVLRARKICVDEITAIPRPKGLSAISASNSQRDDAGVRRRAGNGKMVMVSEFFNEDDPDFDHFSTRKWLSTG